MMKAGTLPTSTQMMRVVGLLALIGVFCAARPALAQTEAVCPPSAGMTPPADLPVTAQQVEDGSASLKDFALVAADQFHTLTRGTDIQPQQLSYVACIIRQEGGAWRSGSTYIVTLTPEGRVFFHAKSMALSGRLLNPLIYAAILQAVGINPADLSNPAAARTALAAASSGNGGSFNLPDIPGANGYVVITPGIEVMLAGFDIDESHVVEEEVDYGNPTITAMDVVDRETLKEFVTQAGTSLSNSGRAAM